MWQQLVAVLREAEYSRKYTTSLGVDPFDPQKRRVIFRHVDNGSKNRIMSMLASYRDRIAQLRFGVQTILVLEVSKDE